MTTTDLHIPSASQRGISPKEASANALRYAARLAELGKMRERAGNHPDDGIPRQDRKKRLPSLAPAVSEADPAENRSPSILSSIDLSSDAIVEEETNFAHRQESKSETARLTVYSLNAILLFMAFPVGFGMLIFNILGGENLRTTAHMIGLTGLGLALAGATHAAAALFFGA